MTLYLTMLRCPDNRPLEARTVEGGEFSIGRGANNNWVLPDPKRYLSSRHCVIAGHSGEWKIRDYSLNGTFLNREDKPIGEGSVRDLRDGDHLRLGAYELEIRVAELATQPVAPAGPANVANPFDLDPLAPRHPGQQAHDPLVDGLGSPDAPVVAFAPATLPHDFDPMDPDPPLAGGRLGGLQEQAPAQLNGPVPGATVHAMLPDDWDRDFAPEPASPSGAAGHHEDAGDLLQVFLRAARLDDMRPADPAAAMQAVGAAFREVVFGLRRVMMSRRDIKTEFRIETTGLLPQGNNPLKFSTSDDDALAALLSAGRRSEMTAADAIAQALTDIRLHELASLAAMQSAVRALLAELEPERLSRTAGEGALNFVSAQRKARAWDAFEAHYKRLSQALADNFDGVFGKAFALAYEKALAEVAAKVNPQ